MAFFQEISLVQFRNYITQSFQINKKVVGICGANGSGKTNLLDVVYYLCFTKSYFSKPDAKNATHGTAGFRIEAKVVVENNQHNILCILRENGKKEFSLDEALYKKFSEHIGKFSCVMIAPDDAALITEGSEERRRFIDTLLCQLYPEYLHALISYNAILSQRNSLLKSANERKEINHDLLDVLDIQLAKEGQYLFEKRARFLLQFIPAVLQQYQSIADKEEAITIDYYSQMNGSSMRTLLQESRQRDILLQRTTVGIHKDDLLFKMEALPFKQLASQGQRKSLLFALKLAEYNTLKQLTHHTPILLLDDVFEKLDADRMMNLLQKVCTHTEAQIFITDTHKERLNAAFETLAIDYQLIEL